MKNTHFLLLFLFLCLNAAFAQTGKYYQQTYSGALGGKYPILMWLQFESGGKVTGMYSYKNVGKPLQLEGSNQSGSLKLTEKDGAKTTGSFTLTLSGGKLAGKWTSADGSKNFDLSLDKIGNETINMKKLHYEAKSSRMEGEEEINCSFNVDVVDFQPVKDPTILINYTLAKLEEKYSGSGQKGSSWSKGTIECSDVNSEINLTVQGTQVGDLFNVDISSWEYAGGAHGYNSTYTGIVELVSGLEVGELESNFKAEKMAELCKLLDSKLIEAMKKDIEADCLTSDEGAGVVYKDLMNGVGSTAKDWEGTLGITPLGISFSRTFEASYAAQVCSEAGFLLTFKELAPYISDEGHFAAFK